MNFIQAFNKSWSGCCSMFSPSTRCVIELGEIYLIFDKDTSYKVHPTLEMINATDWVEEDEGGS